MTIKQKDFYEIQVDLNRLQGIIFGIKVLNNPYDPCLSRNYACMLYKAKVHRIKFKKHSNSSPLSHKSYVLDNLINLGFIHYMYHFSAHSESEGYELTKLGNRYVDYTFPHHNYHPQINKQDSHETSARAEPHPKLHQQHREKVYKRLITIFIMWGVVAFLNYFYESFSGILSDVAEPLGIIMLLWSIFYTVLVCAGYFSTIEDPDNAPPIKEQTFVQDIKEHKGYATKKNFVKFLIQENLQYQLTDTKMQILNKQMFYLRY